MAEQDPGKLTASLEELSLKKQLPLRQQVQKPMLKYSNSVIKPVQLFNHADLVTIRNNAEAARNAYSSLSQASGKNVMNTPFRSSATTKPSPTPQTLLKQATGSNGSNVPNTPTSPAATPKSATSRGHSNPYARPLSAKDIVSDLQGQNAVKKAPSFSQINSGSVGGGGSGTPMFGFQMNAFMRPQSAMRKDPPPQPKPQPKASITANSESEQEDQGQNGQENRGQKSSDELSPRKSIPPTKLERENDLSDIYLSSKVGTAQTAVKVNQFGPAKPRSAASVNLTKNSNTSLSSKQGDNSSPSKVTAYSQTSSSTMTKTDDKLLSKVVVKNEVSTNMQTKSVIYAKPVSSIPRPGSAAPSPGKPLTPDSQKVRNLNYTPTKPYSEVMNPASLVSGKPPISAITKTQQTTATAITIKHESNTKTTNHSTPSSPPKSTDIKHAHSATYSRSSKQSSSSSATQYYRKGSKVETMYHEQRPPAVGAPSKGGRVLEKDSLTSLTGSENGAEDEEEESVRVPSGERLPGDGEASVYDDDDEFVDEEDDAIDNLDDDCIGGSEGESDGYSFTSSLSRRSSSAHLRFKSRPCSGASSDQDRYSRPTTASSEKVKPGLTKSHFSNIPPTINFVAEGEKVEQLPWDIRKFMKWRLSPITPNVVKGSLARIGFRITKRNHDWLGCWGKHMKSPGFKSLREYQKLNHFPGSFQIGRKDRLWRNLSKMQVHFGKKEFGFFPQTYCMPFDSKLLKRAWEDGGNKQKWIIKPPASARGIGIKVISKWTQIPRRRPVIVQKYLARPYLINDSKFDLRIYVYISCYDPLRLYVYEDGLARFASMKYSSSMKHLNNKFMHLTNYSVNKKNADYQANGDDSICQGHKWSLKALWNYMKRQGINTNAIWDSIKDLIIKTIICSDGPVNSMIKANCKNRYCVHELFGFDILLDESLKPWILEVNISPSLHSNSQLDVNIKGHMIKDLMNIAGFRIPDKHDVSQHGSSGQTDLSMYVPPNSYCMDKRLFSQQMSPDERAKHAYYSQRHQDEHLVQTMLDTLTPDDIRCLTESIDEDGRKGGYQRVFPTPSTHKYLKYFETARYYNLLLDQWVQRYNRMEQRGIALLESFCDEGLHLEMNTEHPNHQWNPPNATCHSFREPRLLSAPVAKTKEDAHMKASYLLKMAKRPVRPSPPRSISQSSSASSINTLIFSPQPQTNIASPRGRAPR